MINSQTLPLIIMMASCQFFPDCSQNNEWPFKSESKCKVVESIFTGAFSQTAPERLSETKLQSWPVLALWPCVTNHPQITAYSFFAGQALDSIHLEVLTHYLWEDSSEAYSFIYMQNDISDLNRSELGATQIFAFRYWRVLRKNREAFMSFMEVYFQMTPIDPVYWCLLWSLCIC